MAQTLRLPPDVQQALRETAAREGRSQNAVIVDAIRRYATDRTRRRDEAVRRIVAEDAELLEHMTR
jgi:predicted transcriptional regulator